MVDRFLDTLSNSLDASGNGRAGGIKRDIDGLASQGRNVRTSRKVLDARMALGADDALYLQTGLGLLWAGDQDLDQAQDLFPSSMGESGFSGATKKAVKTEMINDRTRKIEGICLALKQRLPSLLYMLSIQEIRDHVIAEMDAMNEPNDGDSIRGILEESKRATAPGVPIAGGAAPDPLGENRIDETLQELTTKLDAENITIDLIAELSGLTSVLAGIYLRPNSSEDSVSLMDLASFYECAAVDVAVAKDYNTMSSLAQSFRQLRRLPGADQGLNPKNDSPYGFTGYAVRERPPQVSKCVPSDGPKAIQAQGTDLRVITVVAPAAAAGGGGGGGGGRPVVRRGRSFGEAAEDDPMPAVVAGVETAPRPGLLQRFVGSGGSQAAPPEPAATGVHERSTGRDWPAPGGGEPEEYFDRVAIGAADLDTGLALWANQAIIPAIKLASRVMENGTCPLWSVGGLSADASGVPDLLQTLHANNADGAVAPADPSLQQLKADTIASLFDYQFGKQRRVPEEQAAWMMATVPALNQPGLYRRPVGGMLDTHAAFHPFYSYKDGDQEIKGLSDSDERYVAYAMLRNLVIDRGPHHEPPPVGSYNPRLTYRVGKAADGIALSPWERGAVNPTYVAAGAETISPAAFVRITTRDNVSANVDLAKHLKRTIGMRNALEGSLEVTVSLNNGPSIDPGELTNQQTAAQTLRPVQWAPVKRAVAGEARPVMDYSPTSVAVCAASTLEHLIDRIKVEGSGGGVKDLKMRKRGAAGPVNLVNARMAVGIAAALKIKQLPHLIKSLVEFSRAGSNAQAMQRAIAGSSTMAVDLVRTGGAQPNASLYATHVSPMRVIQRRNALTGAAIGPPSLSIGDNGDDIAPAHERLMMATTGIFVDGAYNYRTRVGPAPQLARGIFDSDNNSRDLPAAALGAGPFSQQNANIAHLPVAFPRANIGAGGGAWAYDGTGMVVDSLPRRRDIGVDMHPEWMAEHGATDQLIHEMNSLVNTLGKAFDQREAFKVDQRRDTDMRGVQFSAERERRGAIWEDALRELSISQDRLYNFLRTMSGTLHESIESVVDFEDHTTESSNRALRERKNEILKQSSQFQSSMVQAVLSQVLRSSNLSFDLDKPEAAAQQLVVVNKESVKKVQELASGSSGLPFFQQNVELEQRLGAASGTPMPLSDLVRTLQDMAKDMRDSLLEQLDDNMMDPSSSKLEYLAKPKNSYIIRMKNESYSAIKTAFSAFVTEWRGKYPMQRGIRAWELIEGVDMHLTTAFAEFAAHKLAHARMHSSSHAAYVGVAPARANAVQLRMTLNKLTNRALEYVSSVSQPDFSAGSAAYTAQAPQDGVMASYAMSNYAGFGMVVGDGVGVNNRRFGQVQPLPPAPPQGPGMARAGLRFGAVWYSR